jgi:hypothetical protein
MVYADKTDLAAYLAVEQTALPADADRLLARASEHVDYVTLGNVDSSNWDHLDAAKKAACAQVEFWMQQGETSAFRGTVESYTIGKVGMRYAQGAGGETKTAPRAEQALMLAGLLYRGAALK